jgi:hypothetical protein
LTTTSTAWSGKLFHRCASVIVDRSFGTGANPVSVSQFDCREKFGRMAIINKEFRINYCLPL